MMEENYLVIKGSNIHYLKKGSGPPVIILHGASYNSTVWDQIGLLDTVAETGYTAIAVDFPGYGKSQEGPFDGMHAFVYDFVTAMGFNKVVLIGASMGGEAALGFAVEHPNMVKGLVLVGAIGVRYYRSKLIALEGIPILLIWGRKDTISSPENYKIVLEAVKTAKVTHIGIRHACYLDDPIKFNEEIRKFLKELR
ncbi:MAG: alpha/beta hydrolase [Sulfolobaceae archaeon]|nr:alpha/beta hydrolase [Sulfolobaceae archaeon]